MTDTFQGKKKSTQNNIIQHTNNWAVSPTQSYFCYSWWRLNVRLQQACLFHQSVYFIDDVRLPGAFPAHPLFWTDKACVGVPFSCRAEWGPPHLLLTRPSQTGVYNPHGIIITHSWSFDGPPTRNIGRKLIAYMTPTSENRSGALQIAKRLLSYYYYYYYLNVYQVPPKTSFLARRQLLVDSYVLPTFYLGE